MSPTDTVTNVPKSREVALAGEHYVAMRLAMAGITPALLPARAEDADVIATLNGRACTIQVKTMGAAGRTNLDVNPERMGKPDFVVIVKLNMHGHYRRTFGVPEAFVFPRRTWPKLWEAGRYRHPKRPNLLTNKPEVQEILDKHREGWHLIAKALAPRPPRTLWPP